MSQFNFGAGTLTLVPSGTDPTPILVGTLQDVSVDFAMSTKELRGAEQFPVDVARTAGKITGKAKSGEINGGLVVSILTGADVTSGQNIGTEETHPIPTTPFQVTVDEATDFVDDLGVINLTSGLAMVRVAATPGAGQYSVNTGTGVYTFNTGDSGDSVSIRYVYSVATGSTVALTNQLMGTDIVYQVHCYNTFRTKSFGMKLWAAVFSKLQFPMKNEDYTMTDLDFECFADSSKRIVDFYSSDTLLTT